LCLQWASVLLTLPFPPPADPLDAPSPRIIDALSKAIAVVHSHRSAWEDVDTVAPRAKRRRVAATFASMSSDDETDNYTTRQGRRGRATRRAVSSLPENFMGSIIGVLAAFARHSPLHLEAIISALPGGLVSIVGEEVIDAALNFMATPLEVEVSSSAVPTSPTFVNPLALRTGIRTSLVEFDSMLGGWLYTGPSAEPALVRSVQDQFEAAFPQLCVSVAAATTDSSPSPPPRPVKKKSRPRPRVQPRAAKDVPSAPPPVPRSERWKPAMGSTRRASRKSVMESIANGQGLCVQTIRQSSPAEVEEFRDQERQRYAQPGVPFYYSNSYTGQSAIVAPIRPASRRARGREHHLLKADRPGHVTILSLVQDASARLPDGIGTLADVVELLRDSQYVKNDATIEQLHTVVSGALDRLHYKSDPCVKYSAELKQWIYMHRDRAPADFAVIPAPKEKADSAPRSVVRRSMPAPSIPTPPRPVRVSARQAAQNSILRLRATISESAEDVVV
jgi:hypothetical protein